MPDSHAYLSASSSSRWIHCSISPRLEAPFPNKSSIFAEEGTAAHAMAEQKLLRYLKRQNSRSPTKYDTPEMDEMTDIYRDFVAEVVEEVRKTCEYPLVLVEDRLDFSKWVPESFGTGDAVIVSLQKLWVIDLKYGKGVWVRAGPDEKSGMPNTQLSLYALGAYSMYSPIFEDIKTVSLSIVQLRLGNIDTYTFPIEQLLTWADEYVKPRALMAFKGEGEAVPGEWCKFCRAKPVCRALAEQAMNLAAGDFAEVEPETSIEEKTQHQRDQPFHFKPVPTLDHEEIEAILPSLNVIRDWIDSVYAYVQASALRGVRWRGFKIVEGKTKRCYVSNEKVIQALKKEGYTDFYKKPELLGITEMTEYLGGRKEFNRILGELIYKPPGKLSLVRDTDKREAIEIGPDGTLPDGTAASGKVDSAENDFAEI